LLEQLGYFKLHLSFDGLGVGGLLLELGFEGLVECEELADEGEYLMGFWVVEVDFWRRFFIIELSFIIELGMSVITVIGMFL
jgi:hypothetical protein